MFYNEKTKELVHYLHHLGLKKGSEKAWNDQLFDHVVIPLMQRLAADKQYNALLHAESYCYSEYVKQTETEAHFKQCFSAWQDTMIDAGKDFAAQFNRVRLFSNDA